MPFDENFQRLARMQNIFGPQNPIGGRVMMDDPRNGGIIGQGPNLSSNMPGSPLVMNAAGPAPAPNPIEQYQPDTRASDMLFQMINQMPQRNKPGIGRKILASLGGLGGGPQMADQMLYQPYYQQMQDWQTKLGPVEKLAGEERMQNANMRQIAALILRDKQAQEREDRLTKEGEARIKRGEDLTKQGEERNRIANERLKIADKVSKGGQLQFDDKGNGILVYRDGTTERVDADLFSPQEKMELQAKYSKEIAQVPRTVYGTSTTSTVTPPEAEQPTQAKQRMINNANKLINEHPEFREVIDFDPDNGLPRVKPEGTYIQGGPITGFFGGKTRKLTADDIKTINKAIEEGKPPEAAKVSTTQRSTTSVRGAAPAPKVTPAAPVTSDKRARAIKILNDAKKPITEANIKHVEEQLK